MNVTIMPKAGFFKENLRYFVESVCFDAVDILIENVGISRPQTSNFFSQGFPIYELTF